MTNQPPPFQSGGGQAGTFVCPKCRGEMRTYDRNRIHIEQCGSCRGIFLDFGEFEALSQMESQFAQRPPSTSYGPGWGSHGNHKYRKSGFASLFFST